MMRGMVRATPCSAVTAGPPLRDRVLDALLLLGVPAAPRAVSAVLRACFAVDLPAARFGPLCRMEERIWCADSLARPAWLVPAISGLEFAALQGLVATSAWPLERRLVGSLTLRVTHLSALLALLVVWERTQAADGVEDDLTRLVARYARGVPGAMAPHHRLVPARVRAMAQAELNEIAPTDREERRAAARALRHRPPAVQMWGQTPLQPVPTANQS